MQRENVIALLQQHRAMDDDEARDLATIRDFVSAQKRFWQRDNMAGHVTASAWVVSSRLSHTLLIHHRKLDRWLQPGGHIESDSDILSAALREAREETGLASLTPHGPDVFDVDVHLIPARKQDPAHHHFDIRFLLIADDDAAPVPSAESNDVRWFSLEETEAMADEASLLRMIAKTRRLKSSQTD